MSNGSGGNYNMEENKKSRSLSSSEWKQIIMVKLDEYENRLRENKRIAIFEDKYLNKRFPLSYIIASIVLFIVISIIYLLSGMRSLSSIIGVIYPFYMSNKILNVQNVNEMNKQDNMLWLSYWIWYGIFTTIENISDVIFYWMGNMYEIMKIALFIYLYHPQTKGSLFLYRKILQPLVIQLIHYEHVMLENVHTLKKNITINDNNIPEQDQYYHNMTNISANTSPKNFNNSTLPSKNNILTSSSIGENVPLNMNNPNTTFVPSFQPMDFGNNTSIPLNTSSINGIPNPPMINTATNPNANVNSNNIIPPAQNDLMNVSQ